MFLVVWDLDTSQVGSKTKPETNSRIVSPKFTPSLLFQITCGLFGRQIPFTYHKKLHDQNSRTVLLANCCDEQFAKKIALKLQKK